MMMNTKEYPAHVRFSDSGEMIVQSLMDHSEHVAQMTSIALDRFGLSRIGFIVGLLHDMGKHCGEFSEYLIEAVRGNNPRRCVNHSFAGAIYFYDLMRLADKDAKINRRDALEFFGNIIVSHHGVHDFLDENGYYIDHSCFDTDRSFYDEAILFIDEINKKYDLDDIIDKAVDEFTAFRKRLCSFVKQNKHGRSDLNFMVGLTFSLVRSALVRADHEDTASFEFGSDVLSVKQGSFADWKGTDEYLGLNYGHSDDSEINKVRSFIQNACASFGKSHTSGVYCLDVPTGAGKTSSGFSCAVANCLEQHNEHVVVVEPLIAIIEQNADSVQSFCGDRLSVGEFHSAIERSYDSDDYSFTSRYEKALSDTWDYDVIVTTFNQFIESVFKYKSKNTKRFLTLCRSVIIVDEVQKIPRNMFALVAMALNFMAYVCGSLVILTSATQPALDALREHHLFFSDEKNIVTLSDSMLDVFKRVKIECQRNSMSHEEIIDFVLDKMNTSFLLTCNTKRDLRCFLRLLKDRCSGFDVLIYGISSDLCPAHRAVLVSEIKSHAKARDKRMIVVATPGIECGVDFSLEDGFRVLSGLDDVVQNGGRVNRHGEYDGVRTLYIGRLKDERLGNYLSEVSKSQNACKTVLNNNVEYVTSALLESFYKIRDGVMQKDCRFFEYAVDSGGTVFDFLSENEYTIDKKLGKKYDIAFRRKHMMKQNFLSASEHFKVFESDQISVVVPYGEGIALIEELCSERAICDPYYAKRLLMKCQRYSVGLFKNQVDDFLKKGALRSVCNGLVYVLDRAFYDSVFGVNYEANGGGNASCRLCDIM